MVLLVPDDPDDSLDEVEGGADNMSDMDGTDDDQPKAQLDDTQASKSAQKVDLDLDDAPFLEDEEEEEDVPFEDTEAEVLIQGEKKKPISFDVKGLLQNKLVWAGGVILLLVIVIVILLMREPSAPPAELPAAPPPTAAPAEQPGQEPTEAQATLIRLAPFVIEQKTPSGEVRILEIRIALSTDNEGLVAQLNQETFAVRNAVFYYLKNKDLRFLTDKVNTDKLKTELLAVINQYLSFGQFEELLIEQYLVR